MFALSYFLLWAALAAGISGQLRPGRWPGLLTRAATWAAWIAMTAGLIGRGLAAGHWPLTNRYEFALCFVWAILGLGLLLGPGETDRSQQARPGAASAPVGPAEHGAGTWVVAVALLVASYALTRPADERAIHPLLPALRSVWLQVHVLSAAVGYAAFGVAAGLGAMCLLGRAADEGDGVERATEQALVWGFPCFTFSILAGAIWAQEAWGRYWGWDPKETWTLIVWLWYLLAFHLRSTRGWRGRHLATLVVAGFALVLFTFAGLPWLIRAVRLTSLHGF